MRVLVVEDEIKLAQALETGLTQEGYEVAVATEGEVALRRIEREAFDLVVLDLMLPRRGGLDVLQRVRRVKIEVPVLVLTARDGVTDRVSGLDAGADDYLVKPFAFAELLARARALLRRGPPETARKRRIADLEMDLLSRRVWRGSHALELTDREFHLLEVLLRHRGQPISRRMLAREVWGEASRATPLDNVIDVHISHLRKKVDRGVGRRLIHTVRGVGYVVKEATS